MPRLIVWASVVAIICACGLSAQSGAASVDTSVNTSINDEPHHRRLLYTSDLRLWDVTLPPGQATQPFLHEYDVATVVIGDGTLNIQRNGELVPPPAPNARGSVIVAEHSGAPATYRIDNSGTTAYHALEIENMHDAKPRPPFSITDLTLEAGAPEAMHQHTGSTIIVLISGALEQGGIGGEEPVRIQQPGQWLVLPRFQGHTVVAAGSGDARAVEIEVR